MTTYSYAFTATENPISDSGNWTNNPLRGGNLQSTGGRCRAATSNNQDSARVTSGISADQYAQVLLATLAGSGGRDGGVLVRMGGTGGDGYLYDIDGSGLTIECYRCDDTGTLAYVKLGATFTGTPTAGHTYKMTISGSTVECFDNGVSLGTRSDATYASGQPGLFINAQLNVANYELDDFEGGDLTAATPIPDRSVTVLQAVNRASTY